MHLWEVILVATGLSLEAFCIAAIKGANQRQLPKHMLFFISLFFGAVMTSMLALGIGIAIVPQHYLSHDALVYANKWFSAVILLFLGFKMLKKLKKEKLEEERLEENITYKAVGKMALQVGIDAILLGMVFGFLKTDLSSIGITFLITSFAVGLGLWLGERMGSGYKSTIDLCSGIVLIIMGVKVILNFFQMI